MVLEGRVVNGVVVPDRGLQLPEGARVQLTVIEEADDHPMIVPDPSLPPDHPLAPYNREVVVNLLRKSIEEMKAGGGRPLEEAMAEIAAKHNFPPLQPD
jgi:hypothetical protein